MRFLRKKIRRRDVIRGKVETSSLLIADQNTPLERILIYAGVSRPQSKILSSLLFVALRWVAGSATGWRTFRCSQKWILGPHRNKQASDFSQGI